MQAQRPAPPRPAAAPSPQLDSNATLAARNTQFDVARDNLSPRFGASTFDMNRAFIETLPQGTDGSINKVLLQAPGVSQDSAASGEIHVRNEHANVQYRINGITLPDGISGFGHVLDTGFVGSLALITGALPAQFGLRTAGIVDIQTKSGNALEQGGRAGIYGGSFGTLTPTFEYGGRVGSTEYFFNGRGFTSNLGIENPTDSRNAIHDRTYQGNFFSYTSTVLDAQTRVATIFGNTTNRFQIPNNPGQMPRFTAFGVSNFDSTMLNEKQAEQNTFGVLALQKSVNGLDLQVSAFSRYSTLHFIPDTIGDLVFNGIASDVYRRGFANGLQGDGAYKLNDAHTLRAGFTVTGESTQNSNVSTVLPLDAGGNPIDAPFTLTDNNSKLGWVAGVYVQDEWRITDKLTLNAGLRFDQMWQYVDANQLSPRVNVVYKPLDGTTFHAGYARYFTPPPQAIAAPANIAPFANTSAQPDTFQQTPVLPERSHYFDAGVVQKITPNLAGRYRRLLQDIEGPAGRRAIRRGADPQRLQLRNRREHRRRTERDLQGRQLQRLRQSRVGPPGREERGVEPISVRRRRARLHRQQLHLHRPRADVDRLGRRILPLAGYPVQREHGLRQRLAQRICQHRPCRALRHGQYRHLARDQGARREADHGALRRRERLRHRLRTQGRIGDRRVRATIRNAPRLLRRDFKKTVRAATMNRTIQHLDGAWRAKVR